MPKDASTIARELRAEVKRREVELTALRAAAAALTGKRKGRPRKRATLSV